MVETFTSKCWWYERKLDQNYSKQKNIYQDTTGNSSLCLCLERLCTKIYFYLFKTPQTDRQFVTYCLCERKISHLHHVDFSECEKNKLTFSLTAVRFWVDVVWFEIVKSHESFSHHIWHCSLSTEIFTLEMHIYVWRVVLDSCYLIHCGLILGRTSRLLKK